MPLLLRAPLSRPGRFRMLKPMSKFGLAIGMLLALCLAAAACSEDDGGGPSGTQTVTTAGGGGTGATGATGGTGATGATGGSTTSVGGSGGAVGGGTPDPVFRVAICQYQGGGATTKPGKIAAMQQALTDLADPAVGNGADMLVFPETAFASYDCAPRPALAEPVPSSNPEDVYHHMAAYAGQHGIWLYYGDYVQSSDPNRPYNAGIMIRPDGSLGFVYDKHYGSNSEAGCGTYGDSSYVFDIGHPLGRIGCLICKDFHAGGTQDIDGLDFDYMLGVAWDANRTNNDYEGHMRQIITTAPAKERGGVWVNMGDDEGESFFMSPAGAIQEEAAAGGGNQLVYHDYDLSP